VELSAGANSGRDRSGGNLEDERDFIKITPLLSREVFVIAPLADITGLELKP
jgi:hypothetical protein